MIRPALLAGLLGLAALAHPQFTVLLPAAQQWRLVTGGEAVSFPDIMFMQSALPRTAMGLMAGAALGLAGSLLQQVTQNRLVSPLTIGAASGGWLALVVAAVWMPAMAQAFGTWICLAGAVGAVGMVVLIAGRRGLTGLPVVLAGMAMHILCMSVARAITLMKQQETSSLFIWGAGDLTQTDWSWAVWLAPRLLAGVVLAALTVRALSLLRLGEAGAAARGLPVVPFMLAVMAVALWLCAVTITAVGAIGFVGLLAPNLARMAGARRPGAELAASALAGALILLATDALALAAGAFTVELVPSGASAALVGAPALIWLARRGFSAADHVALRVPGAAARLTPARLMVLAVAIVVAAIVSAAMARGEAGWTFGWPSELIWSLRWPRLAAALGAGAGMAAAGVVLQRLIRNPLASPDILGMTAGAALALVAAAVLFDVPLARAGAGVAAAGTLAVLGVLLMIGRRHNYAPAMMALTGISLMAMLDGMAQFILARGDEGTFALVGWLAGSTYRVPDDQAVLLCAGTAVLVAAAFALSRWLTLVGAGDDVARARGLDVSLARPALMTLAALMAALVTATVGPLAFVGLIAPHMATLAGARTARQQLAVAVLLGMGLMAASDWAGRVMLYPVQLPAGLVAAVAGGVYFIALMARRRRV